MCVCFVCDASTQVCLTVRRMWMKLNSQQQCSSGKKGGCRCWGVLDKNNDNTTAGEFLFAVTGFIKMKEKKSKINKETIP